MSTIEITAIEDLREGDYVTLRWEKSEGATVTLEGPMRSWAVRSAITDERFVSATREVPEWEPGTAGTATVRGVQGMRVMRRANSPLAWATAHAVGGDTCHAEGDVTDFVPDDASRWAAQAKLVEADLDNAGAKIKRLIAEVERLRAARQAPTRKRIVDAMWPDAPEGTRDGLAHTDMVDRVMALIEQGGAS